MSENKISKELIIEEIFNILKEIQPGKITKEVKKDDEGEDKEIYIVALSNGKLIIEKDSEFDVCYKVYISDIKVSDIEKEEDNSSLNYLTVDSRIFQLVSEVVFYQKLKAAIKA